MLLHVAGPAPQQALIGGCPCLLTLDAPQEALGEAVSVLHSAFCSGKGRFEIVAERLNDEDAESKDEKHFAFVSSLFKTIFQFYLGFN